MKNYILKFYNCSNQYSQVSAQKFEEFECVAIDNFISLHAVLNDRGQGVMSSGKTHSFLGYISKGYERISVSFKG